MGMEELKEVPKDSEGTGGYSNGASKGEAGPVGGSAEEPNSIQRASRME